MTAETVTIHPVCGGLALTPGQHLPLAIWRQMGQAGAEYWSAEDVEEMGSYGEPTGWRYTRAALEVLLNEGYTLRLRGQLIATSDELRYALSPEGSAAAVKALADAEAAARAEAAEKAREEEARRQAAGEAYTAWREEHTVGLVETSATAEYLQPGWEKIAFFDKTTPGAWYDTGDTWYRKTIDGNICYRCDYGSATVYWAPEFTVNAWCLEQFNDNPVGVTATVVRHVDEKWGWAWLGGDVYERLLGLIGEDRIRRLHAQYTERMQAVLDLSGARRIVSVNATFVRNELRARVDTAVLDIALQGDALYWRTEDERYQSTLWFDHPEFGDPIPFADLGYCAGHGLYDARITASEEAA